MQVNGEFQPTIVAFCCNWCSYAGADLSGTNRLQYPANVKIIRIPCSCRLNPLFILRAFQRGADGVILCGCHPGDCHYTTGNYYARRRMLARRLNGKYLAPHCDHLDERVKEIAEGKYEKLIEDLMGKPLSEIQELYNNRDIEA